jgi:glycolate oxidase FAD binding subunit
MTVQPHTIEALQEAVVAHDRLRIRTGGTKSSDSDGVTVSLRALSGVVDYAPDECVMTALAGTPILDIERELSAHGQYLPFDPPLSSRGATIGGTVAAGTSGSLRYRYGGVRDFVIGARVIDGEGRVIRSGGKVVKNAAGFLLHHAMVGSRGRFGVLSEVTFKVFPRPEARATVRVECGRVDAAAAAARTLEGRRFDLEALDFDDDGTLWIRIAGRAEALQDRAMAVLTAVGGGMLVESDEEAAWADARDFTWADASHSIAKIPLNGPSAFAAIHTAAVAGLNPFARSSAAGEPRTRLRFWCGGRSAWAAVNDVSALSRGLSDAGLVGVIVRGPGAGLPIGAVAPNPFEDRVRRVLDPRNRFCAASDSH